MNKASSRIKLAIIALVNLAVLMTVLYLDDFRELPFIIQLLPIAIVAALQTFTGNTYDYIRERATNVQLLAERDQLELSSSETRTELNEFRQVVASFLEHSEIYRERVKDHLKLQEDYLCIAKSSEGLSVVWNALLKKVRMPFTTTLMRIPGTVMPFERMGLFLVPVANLPGINEWNIRSYIAREIVPEVKKERVRFLRRPRKNKTARPDKFSYKYMAFLLRKGSIAYEVENRKFNREFNAFIVDGQAGGSYRKVKNELTRLVKTKDLLSLANWASFADLNRDQSKFVEKNKHRMSEELTRHGIGNLTDIANITREELFETLWPILRRRTTKRKAMNIFTKVIDGARNTVEVLERNGVKL